MKKQIDEKKLARRSFLRLITGFSAATSGIFLGLISPASAWNGQQEGTDSSDRAASDSDSDSFTVGSVSKIESVSECDHLEVFCGSKTSCNRLVA